MWCSKTIQRAASAISAFLLTCFAAAPNGNATCILNLQGSAASVMRLSVLDYGSPDNGVQRTESIGETAASVTFGDRVGANGSHAKGHIGLQVKSNCPYDLRMSRTAWVAQNLQYKGQVVGSEDGGSFVRVSSRGVTGSGYQSNPTGTVVEPRMTGSGTLLSQVSSGPVTLRSTLLAHGSQASLAGGVDSPCNGVVVHLDLSCVDGNQLTTLNRDAQGFFQTTLQFQVFAQRL